jgi:hypothetical protein
MSTTIAILPSSLRSVFTARPEARTRMRDFFSSHIRNPNTRRATSGLPCPTIVYPVGHGTIRMSMRPAPSEGAPKRTPARRSNQQRSD